MSFPRYPRYKDSGVEWLGEVPEHWTSARLKHLGTIKGGAGFPHDDQGAEGEELPFHKVNALAQAVEGQIHLSENTISRGTAARLRAFVFPPDTIVFAKVGAALLLGRLCRLSTPACIDNNMMGLIVKSSLDVRFIHFAMSTVRFDWLANPGAVPSVNESQIGNFELVIPPSDEQRLLVTFLERETAKIDALITEQQRLIELLKEKRQAVISHAVTRGLNPDAPLKPSGVEWLGDVPAHWTLCLLKRVFQTVDYGISDSLAPTGAVAVLRMGNIAEGRIKVDELKYVDAVDSALLLSPGDLLYNRTNSLDQIAKVGLYEGSADIPVSFASYLVRLRTRDEVLPEYMMYYLNTPGMLGVARASAFVAIGQCNLNPSRYGEIPVAIPPRNEQKGIVQFLEKETHRINRLIAQAQSAIALLQERRTALISAAVTGKIDVRELADRAA